MSKMNLNLQPTSTIHLPYRLAIIFVLLIFPKLSFTQELDSLEDMLPGLTGVKRMEVLNSIAMIKQVEGGEEEAKEALEIARKKKSKKGEAESLSTLGYIYFHQSDYEKAKDYFRLALEIDDEEALFAHVFANTGRGEIAVIENELNVALEHGLVALEEAKKTGIFAAIMEARHLLTLIYDSLSNFEASAKQLDSILIQSSSLSNYELATLYLDIGENRINRDIADSALYYLNKSKKIILNLENEYDRRYLFPYLYANFAGAYILKNLPDSALLYVGKAFELDSALQDTLNMALDFLTMSDAFLLKKDYHNAKIFAVKTLAIGKNVIGIGYMKNLYRIFKELSTVDGDFKKALQYRDTMLNYADSINNFENVMAIMEQKAAFELKNKKAEIATLKKENETKQQLILWGVVLTFLLILGMMLLYGRIQWEQKKYETKMELVNLQEAQQQQALVIAAERKSMEQQFLSEKVDIQKRALASNAVFIANKNQLLIDVHASLAKLIAHSKGAINQSLMTIKQRLNENVNPEKDWEYFEDFFKLIYPDFHEKIREKYPHLTDQDYRLCCYIYLNMTNKEIARLQNITTDSVLKARYRLKRKMKIEGALTDFIINM